MWQALKEALAKHIVEVVIVPSLILFGTLFWLTVPSLLTPLWLRLEPQTLQRILGLSVLSVLVLLAYAVYLLHQLRNRLRVMFGIKWAKDAVPYCPACEKPLSAYGQYTVINRGAEYSQYEFRCVHCEKRIPILDDEGNHVLLADAKRIVLERRTFGSTRISN